MKSSAVGVCSAAVWIAAPDAGNAELLIISATAEQKEEYLRPLAAGEVRSCFAMTEPEVAGSDPTGLRTTAVQRRRRMGHQRPQVVYQRRDWFSVRDCDGRY